MLDYHGLTCSHTPCRSCSDHESFVAPNSIDGCHRKDTRGCQAWRYLDFRPRQDQCLDQSSGTGMPAKLPTHCYWRKDTIWGRVIIAGREYRRSLRTADPREAARRIKAWQTKL